MVETPMRGVRAADHLVFQEIVKPADEASYDGAETRYDNGMVHRGPSLLNANLCRVATQNIFKRTQRN